MPFGAGPPWGGGVGEGGATTVKLPRSGSPSAGGGVNVKGKVPTVSGEKVSTTVWFGGIVSPSPAKAGLVSR